jgi:hypothetical protein
MYFHSPLQVLVTKRVKSSSFASGLNGASKAAKETLKRFFPKRPTQTQIAKAYGVTVRAIRKRKRKKGKNWSPESEMFQAPQLRPHPVTRLCALQNGPYSNAILEASRLLHGIQPGQIVDPHKKKLWHDTKVADFIHPAAHEAVKPKHALRMAETKIRLAGVPVTREALAVVLGVSMRTLYWRYGKEKLSEICKPVSVYSPPVEFPRRTRIPNLIGERRKRHNLS